MSRVRSVRALEGAVLTTWKTLYRRKPAQGHPRTEDRPVSECNVARTGLTSLSSLSSHISTGAIAMPGTYGAYGAYGALFPRKTWPGNRLCRRQDAQINN
jgi:hypothetical protein